MAMYSPIRDAFADMNKLMLDSQQWDERRAAANQQAELKHTMLQSQIEQRQFNNDMSQKEYLLRERGADDRAEQSEFNRMHANRQWEAAEEVAGDNAEFHDARMKKASIERQQMQNDLDEENNFLDERDKWLQDSTNAVFKDPVESAMRADDSIRGEIKSLEGRLSNMNSKNPRVIGPRGALKEQINAARGRWEKSTVANQGPEQRIKSWREAADNARELAPLWLSHGRTQEGNALMRIADAYDKRATGELANAVKARADRDKIMAKDAWDKRFDRFGRFYGEMDDNNQIFLGPGAQGRVAIAQQVSQMYAEQGGMTDGELFLLGMKGVDTVEQDLASKVQKIEAAIQAGAIDPLLGRESITAVLEEYGQEYKYIPEGFEQFMSPNEE